jgi:hypothetical protein
MGSSLECTTIRANQSVLALDQNRPTRALEVEWAGGPNASTLGWTAAIAQKPREGLEPTSMGEAFLAGLFQCEGDTIIASGSVVKAVGK